MTTLTASFPFLPARVARSRPLHRVVSLDVRGVPYRDTLRLPDAIGKRITCVLGHVWLTQEGDLRDIVLAPGQSHTFTAKGLVLAYGLERASIALD